MMLKICQSFFLCSTQQMCSLKHLLTSNSTHLVLCHSYCVVPEKKSIPTTWKVIGKELSKAKILEAKYEAKLESLGGQYRKTFCGGSKDIFWNYTSFM